VRGTSRKDCFLFEKSSIKVNVSMENGNGISRAILHLGSQKKLADELGVTQQFISYAKQRGWVSPDRAKQIETITGIDRWELIEPKVADTLKDG
tara:strand:- start:732 stop:1013 length:282 start_codon:yes stop_codon:yes gene_type:complete